MKCVILAGGSGTRFWPYSRHSRPKQLLNIVGDKSMLQMTVDRLKKIRKVTDIYIVTREDLYDYIVNDISGAWFIRAEYCHGYFSGRSFDCRT